MTDRERFERVSALFLEASRLPREEVERFLAEACGTDESLKQQVRQLLDASGGESVFGTLAGELDSLHGRLRREMADAPTLSLGAGLGASGIAVETAGDVIGRYRLLEMIGEGGFGRVWMAEQREPVQRRVALKVIKIGMDTKQVVARFEQERQALAVMDHPNIAKVLDAGSTATGRPYFVMELCKGDPISEFCDAQNLTISERLELAAQVCTAVQHAHTKGIIHRDLKPSNVLVAVQDGRPQAKVIDFGIAKATQSRLTEKTLFTEHRQLVGTPEYMSPEQASGSLDIDTRTDVYSLGVLLYELLTGSTPFSGKELRSAALGEIERIIREVDPPAPSTRLSQSGETIARVAASRKLEPSRLGAIVRGELDWIVMKALEKDRARRYESASALAADLKRYLSGDPVLAAPPSGWYRTSKFVRRNKGAVAAVSAITVSLLVGAIAFAWQARVASAQRDVAVAAERAEARQRQAAEEQRRLADEQRDRAVKAEAEASARANDLQVLSEFQAGMLTQIDPNDAGRKLVKDLASKLDATLAAAKPPVSDEERAKRVAALTAELNTLNATDVARGFVDRTILRPGIDIVDQKFKEQPLVDATLRYALATQYQSLGLYSTAEAQITNVLATRRRLLGDDNPQTINAIIGMANALWFVGKRPEAERMQREAYERSERVLPEGHADRISSMSNMGFMLQSQGKMAEAEPYWRKALEMRRKYAGAENNDTLTAMNNLGGLLQSQGKLEEAEPFWRETLEIRRRVLGNDHAQTMTSIGNLGFLLLQMNRNLDEAELLLRESLDRKRRVLGQDHPETLGSIKNLGLLFQAQGRLDDADASLTDSVERYRRVLGPQHPNTIIAVGNLGSLRAVQGRYDDVLSTLEPIRENMRKSFGGGNAWRYANVLTDLGQARTGLAKTVDDYRAAEALLLEAREIFAKVPGPFVKDAPHATKVLINCYEAWDRAAPGQGLGAKAEALRAGSPGPDPAKAGPR